MKRLALILFTALWWAAWSPQAAAHALHPAYLGITELGPGDFQVQWKVSIPGGLADALAPRLPDECRGAGPPRRYQIADALIEHWRTRCLPGRRAFKLSVDGLPATRTDVLVHVAYRNGATFTGRLTPLAPQLTVPASPGFAALAGTYLRLGVEHILLGYDHLLFVLALMLLVRNLRRLVATVTAFTVAHSITLAAATLGFVHVPAPPVEMVIALSILFLATELARGGRRPRSAGDVDLANRYPWIVAFVFGLLHGFGFAGALSSVGLPERAIPTALLFFNLGVEAGQLCFIAAAATAAALLSAVTRLPRWWRQPVSYGIGIVSAFWVIQRAVLLL